jgi:hypothetical protein
MPLKSVKTGEDLATVLANSGMKFSDWPKGQVVEKETTQGTVVVVKRDAVSNLDNYGDIPYRYDLKMYHAIAADGRKFTLREVCNNCKVSMVQCTCDNPTILGDIHVTIRPIK